MDGHEYQKVLLQIIVYVTTNRYFISYFNHSHKKREDSLETWAVHSGTLTVCI